MEIPVIHFNCAEIGGRKKLFDGEIKGTRVFHMSLKKGETFVSQGETHYLKVFFLVEGAVTFSSENTEHTFDERACYVPRPGLDARLVCLEDAALMELHWYLTEEDLAFVDASSTAYPFVQKYLECSQYHEDVKSDKSISRSIVEHHEMPRFAMGSNQSYGPDQVGIHAHPLLDQYFFSFPENKVDLLIDGERVPFGGNAMIHIPLGSHHGVDIPADGQMHYIWIDFLIDPAAVAFLDTIHRPTEEMKSL